METVLKVFQVTRCVLPGMVVGLGDRQLRTVLSFAGERRLYGGPVSALPPARATLTGAFVDLLICDALAMVAARTLHLAPREASVRSAAVKYLVPKLLQDSSHRLGVLLGARSYVREGPYAGFQKTARDLPVVALAHASGAVCLSNIVPQLPRLADRAWRPAASGTRQPYDDSLFRLHDPLPALDLGRLELTARGADGLAALLPEFADDLARRGPGHAELAALAAEFTGHLADLADRASALPPQDRTPSPAAVPSCSPSGTSSSSRPPPAWACGARPPRTRPATRSSPIRAGPAPRCTGSPSGSVRAAPAARGHRRRALRGALRSARDGVHLRPFPYPARRERRARQGS